MRVLARALLLVSFCFIASIFSYADSQLSRGKFLIATQQLNDPRFSQSVVLLIRYDTSATVGLILNLPTKVLASKAFPGTIGFTKSDLLFLGGPVDSRQFCLLIQKWSNPTQEESKVFDNVYMASTEETIKKIVSKRNHEERIRFYVGYAGWSPGQLETEIQGGYWLVYRGLPDHVFDSNPAHLWKDLLNKASVVQAKALGGRAAVPAW